MPPAIIDNFPTLFICDAEHKPPHPLLEYLTGRNFIVHCIRDSSQAIDHIVARAPDIVLLGADLPAAGGYEVLSTVRPYYNGPILFQGRDGEEAAQLLAFELGADDFIQKPVSPALLTARICARLKRIYGTVGPERELQCRIGDLVVDASCREVSMAGRPVELTSMQFDLLWYMIKRAGRVISREELHQALYRHEYNGFGRSVDVNISRIRSQLGDDAENPRYLKTVRGVGYLIVARNE